VQSLASSRSASRSISSSRSRFSSTSSSPFPSALRFSPSSLVRYLSADGTETTPGGLGTAAVFGIVTIVLVPVLYLIVPVIRGIARRRSDNSADSHDIAAYLTEGRISSNIDFLFQMFTMRIFRLG
jgi:hypothetical protein